MSQRDDLMTLAAELGSMVFAGIVGRTLMKSRGAILFISLLGALGAMIADILVDGQGACFYLVFTPLIYFAATAGRYDLRA